MPGNPFLSVLIATDKSRGRLVVREQETEPFLLVDKLNTRDSKGSRPADGKIKDASFAIFCSQRIPFLNLQPAIKLFFSERHAVDCYFCHFWHNFLRSF